MYLSPPSKGSLPHKMTDIFLYFPTTGLILRKCLIQSDVGWSSLCDLQVVGEREKKKISSDHSGLLFQTMCPIIADIVSPE